MKNNSRKAFKKSVNVLSAFYLHNPSISDQIKNFQEISKCAQDFEDQRLAELLMKASESFQQFLNVLKKIQEYTQAKNEYTV